MKKGISQIIISIALILMSLWCLMWVLSSASLSSGFCDSKFSLFHEHFRCRQPNIAFILWLVFGVSGAITLVLGLKNVRNH